MPNELRIFAVSSAGCSLAVIVVHCVLSDFILILILYCFAGNMFLILVNEFHCLISGFITPILPCFLCVHQCSYVLCLRAGIKIYEKETRVRNP